MYDGSIFAETYVGVRADFNKTVVLLCISWC
jgi:hypothetical protein